MEITEVKVNKASDRQFHPKLYVFHEGENILENLANRYQRKEQFYRNEVLPAAFKKLAETKPLLAELLSKSKASWSQKCGCACGCSPGFTFSGMSKVDIFVTVKS